MKNKRGFYDVFMKTCARCPSNVAVRLYEDGVYKNYTYSELYGVCEYVSQVLQQLHCNRGTIGLITDRNILVPCVVAAAHKCCTTFIFLDPTQNFNTSINNLKLKLVLAISSINSAISLEYMGRKPDKIISVFDLSLSFYDLDTNSEHNMKQVLDHSFIAMTSGSTGEPKHIQVPVQCIQPNIDDLTKIFNITEEDVIYFSTPLTFDPSMVEILLAYTNGASLLIAPCEPEILFPRNRKHAITVWQTTPSNFFQLPNCDIRDKILCDNSPLKILAFGGEPFNGIKRLKELTHIENQTKIFTLYGVTEMSCWSCVAELDLLKTMSDKELPLGRCLSETEIMVRPGPGDPKDTGNIILVSKTRKCVILNKANGREEINSLKFIDTGDIGEMKNGTVYYRGRRDDFVKRFGCKINLQHIENTVMQCPMVKTCSCVWMPKPMLLVVYFSSETVNANELKDFLKCKIDEKHWPDKVVRVDNLPTNKHGKISKIMLNNIFEKAAAVPNTIDSLKTHFIDELGMILNKNYSYEEILEKNFLSIGGTSFLAVTLCNRLSITAPHLGELILPQLLSQKATITDIMKIVEKEVMYSKKKKKGKRHWSESESMSTEEVHSNKRTISTHNPLMELVVMWNYDTGKCVDASPTLFQSGLNVYVTVGSHSGKIIVANAISGAIHGTVDVKSRVEAPVLCYNQPVGPSAPCGIVGTYDGTLTCFLLDTCAELWKTNIGSMIKSKATCYNGFVYVAAYDGNIWCIDVMTGVIKEAIHVADQAISADLVLAKNEFILSGTLSGVCASVHTPTNSVAWRGSLGGPVFASPVLYDNDKYVVFAEVNGEIHCRTVEKGIKIWKYQGAKGNIFSSIYIKEIDKLKWQMVFGCHDNKVYSINIKNFQPSLHWKCQLTSPIYSTPCGFGNKMLIAASNDGRLCVLDSSNGAVLTEYQLPNETFSSPAVYDNFIFIGCRDDQLYSLKCVSNSKFI